MTSARVKKAKLFLPGLDRGRVLGGGLAHVVFPPSKSLTVGGAGTRGLACNNGAI
jgi:hypothetical protein